MATEETTISLPTGTRPGRAWWRRHYDRWQASGLSRAAFCRREQINASRFYYYCRVFGADGQSRSVAVGQRAPAPSAFLPLTLAPDPEPAFRLQVADVTLSCNQTVPAEQLSAWIRAIRNTL